MMNRSRPFIGLLDGADFDDDDSGNGSRQGFSTTSMQPAVYYNTTDSGMTSPPTPSSLISYGSRNGSFDCGVAPIVVGGGIVSGSPFVGNSCSPPASHDSEPPRCRSNTWHGQARHSMSAAAVGRDGRGHFLPASLMFSAVNNVDDHNIDMDEEEAAACANRSTPSNSIDSTTDATDVHGFFMSTANGADRSSGCGSSSSSVNGVGCGLNEIGGDARGVDLGGAVTAAMQAAGCRKSSSRRNAWGNLSYADLITKAIESTPERRLTLAQIYAWMVTNVPFFRDKGDNTSSAGWKVSSLEYWCCADCAVDCESFLLLLSVSIQRSPLKPFVKYTLLT